MIRYYYHLDASLIDAHNAVNTAYRSTCLALTAAVRDDALLATLRVDLGAPRGRDTPTAGYLRPSIQRWITTDLRTMLQRMARGLAGPGAGDIWFRPLLLRALSDYTDAASRVYELHPNRTWRGPAPSQDHAPRQDRDAAPARGAKRPAPPSPPPPLASAARLASAVALPAQVYPVRSFRVAPRRGAAAADDGDPTLDEILEAAADPEDTFFNQFSNLGKQLVRRRKPPLSGFLRKCILSVCCTSRTGMTIFGIYFQYIKMAA